MKAGLLDRLEVGRRAGEGGWAPDDDRWYPTVVGAVGTTTSGISVDERGALTYSPVWACVNILAQSVAQLPFHMYRRLKPRGKERAPDHPLYPLLHDLANPYVTAYHMQQRTQAQVLLWGNAYMEIERDRAGRPLALWPLPPNRVSPRHDGKSIVYDVKLPTGDTRTLDWRNVFHLAGLGFDGLQGYSVISMARESLGLGMAAGRFGAKLFGQGVRQSGYLQHPGTLGDKALANLKQSTAEQYAGLDNAMRVMVLEEGMTFKESFIPPNDAQFLETRQFEVVEVCRWFNVPPHMVKDLMRATFSNIEHQSIDFVVHSLMPWLRCWENTTQRDLIDEADRKEFFAAFLVKGLLRGDVSSRYEAYTKGRQWGWLSANDVRELEDENPLPGDQGDQYMVPLNMISASALARDTAAEPGTEPRAASVDPALEAQARSDAEPPVLGEPGPPLDPAQDKPTPAAGDEDQHAQEKQDEQEAQERLEAIREERRALLRERLRAAHRLLFVDLFRRVLRADCAWVLAAARKDLGAGDRDEFLRRLGEFYGRHEEKVAQWSLAALSTYAETLRVYLADLAPVPDDVDAERLAADRAAACARDYCEAARAAVESALEGADATTLLEDIEASLGERESDWPAMWAEQELDRAGAVFEQAMVEKKRTEEGEGDAIPE